MADTPSPARIEAFKLAANWFNTVSAGLITVGVFTPTAIWVYGIGDEPRNSFLFTSLPVVCICGSFALHLMGQWFILKLSNDDDRQ
uniref:Uncharacterized protein n=1 Tax=Rhodopseudomonas palustris (strain BisA53) TaxID=316055 RepID=Q07TB1_RHOP5